jgi:hypothetical protein
VHVAAASCAEFIQVMRMLRADTMTDSLDRLREDLAASVLVMAETAGTPREAAGRLARPLRDA